MHEGNDPVGVATDQESESAQPGCVDEQKAAQSFEDGEKFGHVHKYIADVHRGHGGKSGDNRPISR